MTSKEFLRIPDRFCLQLEFQGTISNFPFNLVMNYCGNNLKDLTIKYHNVSKFLTVKLRPIFKQLQKLNLTDVRVIGDTTLFVEFNQFNSLIELRVCHVKRCSVILENTFHKLERFVFKKWENIIADSIGDTVTELSLRTLTTFISRHSLKALSLSISCDDSCQMNIVHTISNSCKDLEELCVDIIGVDITFFEPFQTLKSLKSLTLWMVTCNLQWFSISFNPEGITWIMFGCVRFTWRFQSVCLSNSLNKTGYFRIFSWRSIRWYDWCGWYNQSIKKLRQFRLGSSTLLYRPV